MKQEEDHLDRKLDVKVTQYNHPDRDTEDAFNLFFCIIHKFSFK